MTQSWEKKQLNFIWTSSLSHPNLDQKKTKRINSSINNNNNATYITSRTHDNTEHSFYCETCQEWIDTRSVSKKEHLRSIPHLVSDPEKPPVNTYANWWSSKGYQIMKESGWDEERPGLGKNQEGRTQPIPTQLKLDKKGLGHADTMKNPPKVTHFRAFEVPTTMKIEKKAPKLNKLQKRMLERKQKEKEKRLHIYMRT